MEKVLRYVARLDSQNPQDEGRFFILSYFLATDMVNIYERPARGIAGGMFLSKMRILKQGSTEDNPAFYSPADFAIGATVNVFGNRFVLTDADLYVLKYLESVSDKIPPQTLESMRQKLGEQPSMGMVGDPST